MPKSFFRCTEDAADAISDLFNFVWPTAAALWNLRWQVKGFLEEAEAPTSEQLSHRFIVGSGIRGADLRTACVDHSWADQQERLASIVLMNAFAIYEHWADQILETLGQGQDQGQALQRIDGKAGIQGTLAKLSNHESAALKAAYYPILTAEKRYSLVNLANLPSATAISRRSGTVSHTEVGMHRIGRKTLTSRSRPSAIGPAWE